MGEAHEITHLRDDHHGGDDLKSFQSHDGIDDGFVPPVGVKMLHVAFVAGDAGVELVDLADEFFKDDAVGGKGQGEIAEVALVGIGPGGLAGVVEAEATQEGEEAGLGAAAVVGGIDPSAAEVADGLVGLIGDEDGDEFPGAVKAGELDGVLLVGFDVIAGFGGDERGRDDGAWHFHFQEHSGDPHAAAARLVANGDSGERDILGLGDSSDGPIQGNLGGGDLAVESDFALRAGIGDGDGCFFFMDVESDVNYRCRV